MWRSSNSREQTKEKQSCTHYNTVFGVLKGFRGPESIGCCSVSTERIVWRRSAQNGCCELNVYYYRCIYIYAIRYVRCLFEDGFRKPNKSGLTIDHCINVLVCDDKFEKRVFLGGISRDARWRKKKSASVFAREQQFIRTRITSSENENERFLIKTTFRKKK